MEQLIGQSVVFSSSVFLTRVLSCVFDWSVDFKVVLQLKVFNDVTSSIIPCPHEFSFQVVKCLAHWHLFLDSKNTSVEFPSFANHCLSKCPFRKRYCFSFASSNAHIAKTRWTLTTHRTKQEMNLFTIQCYHKQGQEVECWFPEFQIVYVFWFVTIHYLAESIFRQGVMDIVMCHLENAGTHLKFITKIKQNVKQDANKRKIISKTLGQYDRPWIFTRESVISHV